MLYANPHSQEAGVALVSMSRSMTSTSRSSKSRLLDSSTCRLASNGSKTTIRAGSFRKILEQTPLFLPVSLSSKPIPLPKSYKEILYDKALKCLTEELEE